MKTSEAEQRMRNFLAGYRPAEGVVDELVLPDGSIREVWKSLVNGLAQMAPAELAHNLARADIYLRDSGVFFRQYDAAQNVDRQWPLSHVPVLLDQDDWSAISAGLCERADLLEKIVSDIYGDNQLVRDGHLPGSLIAHNPEWLRSLVGVKPRSGHYLHFLAFDIGRGPKGNWWVLGDRTQAPSGIGFSLENRIATKLAFSRIYEDYNIHRVAGFFQKFREAMDALKGDPKSLVGILTPGQFNESYFEHAYIARYLGLLLVTGEDLTIRGGQLMVRTIDGLYPIEVLWRRLDAKWLDPLELEETSLLGTAGIVGAIRDNAATLINAPGVGVLETRALQAFVPKLARTILGKPLALPNIATWWCGAESERNWVKANLDKMVVGGAFSTRLPFDLEENAIGADVTLGAGDSADLLARIDANGDVLVGQEAVTLSTTPAFSDGRLVQRPMSLRVFLARTGTGWEVMPGGFARIGKSGSSNQLALQQGGSVADVWIVSKQKVRETSLLEVTGRPANQTASSILTCRAGENLFWLGRYLDRAEHYFRMLRAYHSRLSESASQRTAFIRQTSGYMKLLGIDPVADIPDGLLQALEAARMSAGHVRDRFSTDGWMALDDILKTARGFHRHLEEGDDTARAMGVLLRKISGISGLVHENMYHFSGWRYLSIGRALERALSMTQMLKHFVTDESEANDLALALVIGDSTMAHHNRFGAILTGNTVVDMLALDPLNPRSVLFQLNQINQHLPYLPGSGEHNLTDLQKRALEMQTALAVHRDGTLEREEWDTIRNGLSSLSEAITETYFR